MDLRSKERLTGAIILVVLVVLVVPELLSGPRRTAEPSSAVATEGPPMRVYTIELGERAARPAQPVVRVPTHAEPLASERGSSAAPQAPAPVEPQAIASAVEPQTPESRPVTGWSIQVGSFASRENAERLAGELRRQDFDTFVVEGTTSGRTLYRVRVGPAGDRAAAQALAGRLASAGRAGSIVPHP